MSKAKVDKVAEQEVAVAKFLEEHRPLLKESELSFAVLEATYVQGAELLKSLSDELKRREGPAVKATNALTDALNERPRVAPKIAKCEKAYNRLRKDFDRVNAAFNRLESFIAEVKARIDGTSKRLVVDEEAATRPSPETPKLPWWKRLFGVHQETSSGVREWPTTPSQADSDCEDYEKLLTWYEQNLEVLEKAVAGRQAGKPGNWQVVIDELLDRMGWCDRHMDTIEQRNADIAGSELVERREGLASRRAELGE